ncbi:PREDICTED: nucleolar complex protein 2 homolog [Polistes canadensis]|uniref:nucleolar complex protein 2 homolog n=1 Tax=Polistes canadensis TaxID=91411 RepID=UPI000718D1A6|nr:PREDICTED: nucleolar complex protein 2 homolog [Polistes canadensis]
MQKNQPKKLKKGSNESVAMRRMCGLIKDKSKKKSSKSNDLKLNGEGPNKKKRKEKIPKHDTESSDSDMDPEEYERTLKNLEKIDPTFYSYLKENDENLLKFKMSSDTNSDDDDDDESELCHKPNDKLEVASDESDFEQEEKIVSTGDKIKLTLQLLKTWQNDIQTDKTSKTIKIAIEAFHAALQTVQENPDEKVTSFKVEGSAIFNEVIQLCIIHLSDALKRFLNLNTDAYFEAHKCKKFIKVKSSLKSYLTDLIMILRNVTSANIQIVLLKHLYNMLPYTQSFSSLKKPLLRVLLNFWSTGDDAIRIIAFLCILRMAINQKDSILETLYKTMYFKYVQNSKFVSPNTLAGINFMRHSLTEIYLLNPDLAYKYAFVYIRQLAIYLRNAITLKKQEHFQAIYNWQYINSLFFWTRLIALSKKQSSLSTLLYPLVQIIIGTIKVIPTQQYYPLRFHCVQMLINISKGTNTFIPILPFLLEVLSTYDFNKKHKNVSMKPISFTCILRMSKSQLIENGFKDSVIDTIYKLILENAAKDSHLISFPELYIVCVMELKAFLKKCHVANYCKKMKQLLEKIEENSKYITDLRSKKVFNLQDIGEIKNWENGVKVEGTNLAKYYDSWIKIHQDQKMKDITQNDELGKYDFLNLTKSKRKSNEEDAMSSEEESDFELRMKGEGEENDEDVSVEGSKNKKLKRKKKSTKSKVSAKNAVVYQNMTEEDDDDDSKEDIVTDIIDPDEVDY